MAILKKGHYHCIECGSLFVETIKDARDQRCPICGNPPTGKILAGTELDKGLTPVVRSGDAQSQPARVLHGVTQDSKDIHEATLEAQGKQRRGRVKRTKRKEKKNKKIWIMFGSWLALMAAIVLLVNFLNRDEAGETPTSEVDTERERVIAVAEAKKKRLAIEAAKPICQKTMTNFLNAPSAAAKAQFVYQGAKLSGVMNRYYHNNPSFSSTRGEIMIMRGEMLDIPDVKVIGTVCKNSLGERFEAIFIFEDKEWKIDWKSLVRYDARSWSLFQSGNDGDKGDFRLYMRVRDTVEDLESQNMNVVFYKPGIYTKNDFSGLASKSVSVPIDSPNGRAIIEMLKVGDGLEKDVFGFTLGDLDPPGYHRVHVRIRLVKKAGEETQMELVKILANHWYGLELNLLETKPDASEGGG